MIKKLSQHLNIILKKIPGLQKIVVLVKKTLIKVYSLRLYLKYRADLRLFKTLGGSISHKYRILQDFFDSAGTTKGHYFHQDLLVASFVFQKNPEKHVDIGSRIDGFVAHVASFRPIEIIDIRDLEISEHKNLIYKKLNMMENIENLYKYTDSISCLHAIEHFGLGRYGDPINPDGHIVGFENIIKMLKVNGLLYISFPIGSQNEIHFNAHRVFHPLDILSWGEMIKELVLERFDFVDDFGNLHQNIDLNADEIEVNYGCGIYTFRKLALF